MLNHRNFVIIVVYMYSTIFDYNEYNLLIIIIRRLEEDGKKNMTKNRCLFELCDIEKNVSYRDKFIASFQSFICNNNILFVWNSTDWTINIFE